MRRAKSKSEHMGTRHNEDTSALNETDKTAFDMDFRQYLGKTVTVFINAGGEVGSGFTGVLIESARTYIKLLMLPSTPPACSLGNACNRNTDNILFCALCPFNKTASAGSMAAIPINSIAAFVHTPLSQKPLFDM